jgi:hypothetical protein
MKKNEPWRQQAKFKKPDPKDHATAFLWNMQNKQICNKTK